MTESRRERYLKTELEIAERRGNRYIADTIRAELAEIDGGCPNDAEFIAAAALRAAADQDETLLDGDDVQRILRAIVTVLEQLDD